MFDLKKKKKPLSYSDTPSAPKLGILSLPSESPRPTHAPLAYEREPTSIMKTPLPERRTMTPLISTNHSKSSRHESPSRDYAPRQRTVSTQEAPLKSILKKTASPSSHSSTTTASSVLDHTHTGSYSAYMKGASGVSSHTHSSSQPIPAQWTTHPTDDRAYWLANSREAAPAAHSHEQPRSRRQSLNQHPHRDTSVPPTKSSPTSSSKYSKSAYVTKEVPLKDEGISLSWPLIDYSSRRRSEHPPIYYDIGFDPAGSEWNVRIYENGYQRPVSSQILEMPISTHCTMTEMVIVCPKLPAWPVVIKRSSGIRVIDVFQGIFDTYYNRLERNEVAAIGPDVMNACKPAFDARCQDSPGLAEYNKKIGMRRVDLLKGKRIFKGLTQNMAGGAAGAKWILEFHEPSHTRH